MIYIIINGLLVEAETVAEIHLQWQLKNATLSVHTLVLLDIIKLEKIQYLLTSSGKYSTK